MGDKDLRRAAEVVHWHRTGKRARAFPSEKHEWAMIRFADYALKALAVDGWIDHGEKK